VSKQKAEGGMAFKARRVEKLNTFVPGEDQRGRHKLLLHMKKIRKTDYTCLQRRKH